MEPQVHTSALDPAYAAEVCCTAREQQLSLARTRTRELEVRVRALEALTRTLQCEKALLLELVKGRFHGG